MNASTPLQAASHSASRTEPTANLARARASMDGRLARFDSQGVFRLGGTPVVTHAFRCDEGELGVRISFDDAAPGRRS